jgi:hypothetical protein
MTMSLIGTAKAATLFKSMIPQSCLTEAHPCEFRCRNVISVICPVLTVTRMIANNLVHPSKDGYPDTVSQVLTFLDPTSSQYHLSFYYHTELKNVDCVLTVRGEGGRQIYFNDFDPEPATVGKYQYTYVSVENITPPSSLAVLVFTWQCSYNKGTSGKVYLDDVYFTSGVLV